LDKGQKIRVHQQLGVRPRSIGRDLLLATSGRWRST
jgi:hypothetical protein